MTKTGAVVTFAAVAVAGVLSGCTTQGAGSSGGIEGSRAKSYSSLAELGRDSDAAVVARATGTSRVEFDGGTPSTVTDVTVLRYLGSRPGFDRTTTLRVRQLGSTDSPVHDAPSLLRPGRRYMLLLQTFRRSADAPTSQVVPTGAAGVYGYSAPDRYLRLDPGSPRLPAAVSEEQVRAAAAR